MSQQFILVLDTFPLLASIKYYPLLGEFLKRENIHIVLWSKFVISQNKVIEHMIPKFLTAIYGLVSGGKNIKELRATLHNRNKYKYLSAPVILIDTHAPSLVNGHFDFAIDLNNHIEGRHFTTVNYDQHSIIKCLEECMEKWKSNEVPTSLSIENEQSKIKKRKLSWNN